MEEKLNALNSLKVVDFSACDDECEYVAVERSDENIKVLLDAGFTAEEMTDAICDDETIDIAFLAFGYANALWWDYRTGFSATRPPAQEGE